MKLAITTLTGEKQELEVAPQDTVKQLKKVLFISGKATSQVRLFQGQTVLEDDRRLCEYLLPEGATISALFEPDADIDIEVSTGLLKQKLTVSNATSIKGLKVQICGVMRCGVMPEKLEIRLGDVALEDPLPLHFYQIKDGTKLEAVKPFVHVTITNNHGGSLFWRLHRNDTIKEVKAKLATALSSNLPAQCEPQIAYSGDIRYAGDLGLCGGTISGINSKAPVQNCSGMSIDGMRLYSIADGDNFHELDENVTVEKHEIKDGDRLYLLTYRWIYDECDVTLTKTKSKLQGVEKDDTCLGIKLRAQDQAGIHVTNLKLFHNFGSTDVSGYTGGKGLPDAKRPFLEKVNYRGYEQIMPLVAITDEELQSERTRIELERKAQQKMREEQQRARLETAATEAGLTVEEYLAEQERKREEARLERERRNQERKEEQARRMGHQGYRR